MLKTRLLAVVVLVCCIAVAGSGCKRTGVNKAKKVDTAGDIKLQPIKDTAIVTEPAPGGGVLPPREVFEKGKRVESQFPAVMFDFDSATVADPERPKIEAVAKFLSNDPAAVVVIEGNCDERGSAEYNMSLGERRALAVRAYLTSLGIAAERMQPRSFGEEKPINPGHDEEAWRQNRRVEFAVMKAN